MGADAETAISQRPSAAMAGRRVGRARIVTRPVSANLSPPARCRKRAARPVETRTMR
jgi:hypothetical protein